MENLIPKLRLAFAIITALIASAGVCPDAWAQNDKAATKRVIESQAELPRYTYELQTPTASALLTDSKFAEVAVQVRRNVEALLDSCTIEDKATLRDLYETLESLAMLRGDYASALRYSSQTRDLEEKPAERLLSGLITEAVVTAMRSGSDESGRLVVFRDAYAAAVNALPWDVVGTSVTQTKGRFEIFSKQFLVGLAQSQYDQAAGSSGRISGEVARDLIRMREWIDVVLPYREPIVQVLENYIDTHRTAKPSIWPARDVTFPDSEGLHPVVIGIWDTGVDAAVFGDQMFTNGAETADSRDDDGNGFIDDVHGIAFSKRGGDPTPQLLYPLDDSTKAQLPQLRDQLKGIFDIQAGVDSREASAIKQRMGQMQSDQVKPFMEDFMRIVLYAHGTYVAGIAASGNPAARILVVRETWPYEMIPAPITKNDAEHWAANMRRTINYLRGCKARVVNLSWGETEKDIEDNYEANGIGADVQERHKMAQVVFDVLMNGMRQAMDDAPDILFVVAAGNTDVDVTFTTDMPAGIDLPNVLSVGAVDQAGDQTPFTSYGQTVRVYADGFEVEGYLPGGERLALSGTSASAPNVTNLAGKLFALDPSLTPEDVVDLIVNGADRAEGGRLVLINPKRSVALASERRLK